MDYTAKYQQYALQATAAYKSYTMTEEDTQECAEFLLALKHRSVTPEPQQENQHSLESQTQVGVIDDESLPSLQNDDDKSDADVQQIQIPPVLLDEQGAMDGFWETLLGKSSLVHASDRDLIPDPLFVAIAQMKPCSLTEADRVGCYKGRPLGFTGMCCRHCGGQPGFGKYFPETVRSLAQTTTSQTILKHIGSKCRFCPSHIREAVLELQRQQVIKETSNSGRPRYGSRKVFFQRLWSRLHGTEESKVDEVTSTSSNEDYSNLISRRKKQGSGKLSIKKKIETKRKSQKLSADIEVFEPISKHSKFEWMN